MGLSSINQENNVNIYPNPIIKNGEVKFKFDNWPIGLVNLIFTDITGRIVLRKSLELKSESQDVIINTEGLNSGMYFAQIENGQLKFPPIIIVE